MPIRFNNWKYPTRQDLKTEYSREYENKPGLQSLLNDPWPEEIDFLRAAQSGKAVEITPQQDAKIDYRSHTDSKEELLSLIKTYRSYPKFRNEKTLDSLYDAFKSNTPITMPIVLRLKNGRLRVFGGNTRMDIAFQLGINPKVFIVDVDPPMIKNPKIRMKENDSPANREWGTSSLTKKYKKDTPGQSYQESIPGPTSPLPKHDDVKSGTFRGGANKNPNAAAEIAWIDRKIAQLQQQAGRNPSVATQIATLQRQRRGKELSIAFHEAWEKNPNCVQCKKPLTPQELQKDFRVCAACVKQNKGKVWGNDKDDMYSESRISFDVFIKSKLHEGPGNQQTYKSYAEAEQSAQSWRQEGYKVNITKLNKFGHQFYILDIYDHAGAYYEREDGELSEHP